MNSSSVPLLGAHEIIAAVSVIDAKIQILHVPLRQPLGIGRRDGGVLQSLKHKPGLYQSRAALYEGRLLEQLRSELVQIFAPVGPGVSAGALLKYRLVAVLLEQLHGGLGGGQQEIVFAGGEPK